MSKTAKAATGLMIATLLAKVLGFGRELVLSYAYGVSGYTDAFLIAFNIPTIIFAGIGSALATTYIPVYYEVEKKLGENAAIKFTNNIFNIIALACLVISVIGFIYTEPLVKVFAMGFKGETLKLAIQFTRIIILSLVFIGLSYLMTAYLQINNNFSVPGLISVPKNIIIIISIILSIKINPIILPIGTLIGISTEFLVQLPFAYKHRYRYKLYLNRKDENIKKVLVLISPIFIGIGVNQINTMIDRTLASTLVEGSISALNYANKLNGFVIGLFIVSISAVVYPMMSKLSSEKNDNALVDTIVKSINSITLLVVPVSVGAIVLCNPIVSILFERGAFDNKAVGMTAIALACYALGLIGYGLTDIIGKIFYSLKDTKTPMIVGIIVVILNIILNLIFIRYLNHAGLALATSISSLIGVIILFAKLKNKIDYFGQDKIISVFIKSIISSLVMAFATNQAYFYLDSVVNNTMINKIIVLIISVLIGALIYAILLINMKIDEIKFITNFIFKKGGSK